MSSSAVRCIPPIAILGGGGVDAGFSRQGGVLGATLFFSLGKIEAIGRRQSIAPLAREQVCSVPPGARN